MVQKVKWLTLGFGSDHVVRVLGIQVSRECEVRHRAQSHDPEIRTRAKIKSRTLNRLSRPGVPGYFFKCEHIAHSGCHLTTFTHTFLSKSLFFDA